MTNILDALNHLDQEMQRGKAKITEAEKHLKTFQKNYHCGNDEQKMIAMQIFCK